MAEHSSADGQDSPGPVDRIAGAVATVAQKLAALVRKQYYKQGGKWYGPRVGAVLVTAWIGFAMVVGVLLAPVAVLAGPDSFGSTAAPVAYLVSLLFVGYATNEARKQVSAYKSAMALQERGDAAAAGEAFAYFDDPDPDTRTAASYTVAQATESSNPGRVVKQSGRDPEAVVAALVGLLDDDHDQVLDNTVVALKYFARDYPEAVLEHEDRVLALLGRRRSHVRMHTAIAVGNLGHHRPAAADDYARRLADVADDEDPDVRRAVAIALSHLDSDRARETLRSLAEDTTPEVAETAREGLDAAGETATRSPEETANPYADSGVRSADSENPYT